MDTEIQYAMVGWTCNEDGKKKEYTQNIDKQNLWKRATAKSKDNTGLNTGRQFLRKGDIMLTTTVKTHTLFVMT
jgi:hypothetical protein